MLYNALKKAVVMKNKKATTEIETGLTQQRPVF